MATKSAARAPSPLTLSRNPEQLRKSLRGATLRPGGCGTPLLARARADVAEARTGTPFHAGHLAGHLEEIGLMPPDGAEPDALVAVGLAVAVRLNGGA